MQKKSINVVLPESYTADVEAVVENAARISDELIEVIEQENKLLESGRPEKIEDLLERKLNLANQFDAFLRRYTAERNVFLLASEARFIELQAKTQKLSEALVGNTVNLQRALTANQRRIDTIMRAIHEDQSSCAPYGANGRQANITPFPVSMKPGFTT